VYLSLGVQVFEAEQQFAADDGDLDLVEDT
jgi:hypothetical protein